MPYGFVFWRVRDHPEIDRFVQRYLVIQVRCVIHGVSRTMVRSERGFVVFPLLFLISYELYETWIVSKVGQVGISRKYRITRKALASCRLEPLNVQTVFVHESIGRCDLVCLMMK